MVITSDFNQFVETYHKNNGTTNPLEGRVIEVKKRKDDTIYFDKDKKKFSYTKKLCLGLLPQDVEEDIARMIHQHHFKTKIFMSAVPKYGRKTLYHNPVNRKYMRPTHNYLKFPIARYLWDVRHSRYYCNCYTKKGTICGNSSDSNSRLKMNTVPMKYQSSGNLWNRVELCKTHKKMIDRQLHGCEDDESYLYYLLGWNYSISHGIPIKLLRTGVRGRVDGEPVPR